LTVFESGQKKTEKRRKVKGSDASNIDGFLGPWAKYVDEKDVAKPSEEEQKELDEITAKRQKRGKQEDDKPAEEKTILHGIPAILMAYFPDFVTFINDTQIPPTSWAHIPC
ncbi:hypothetical protein FKM82_029811, partial [Ascaphus truei]